MNTIAKDIQTRKDLHHPGINSLTKWRNPYTPQRERTTWFKIRNPKYSQMDGREKLFERERHSEPVPGWHSCDLACGEL